MAFFFAEPAPDPRAGANARLLAVWDGGSASCALPASGEIVLGRSQSADLRISSTSVAREHALVRAGSPPTLQDLGSSNGTRVGGVPLEAGQAVPLSAGRVIELGSALVVLQEDQAASDCPPSSNGGWAMPPSPGEAGQMDRLRRLVDLVATGTLNVLLRGEVGVGKAVVAERIHQRSVRGEQPFLKIDCAALAESLVESELFGHERGAFGGAKAGLLEAASGGTVLLGEVAELALPMQAKLARAVSHAEVSRIGSLEARPIDVRLIATTSADVSGLLARGALRADLYSCLNGISLTIPALRERTGEIAAFSRELLAESSARLGLAAPELSARASSWLVHHAWPGNIRELRSVIERAVRLARGGVIDVEHLWDGQ